MPLHGYQGVLTDGLLAGYNSNRCASGLRNLIRKVIRDDLEYYLVFTVPNGYTRAQEVIGMSQLNLF